MRERPIAALVLAAGFGTRMRSSRPKPLHVLCGRPMVIHVLDALTGLEIDRVVLVVGHGAERIVKTLSDATRPELTLHYVEQEVQRGTGDAVAIALNSLPEEMSDENEEADVLVLPGDTPLLEASTVSELIDQHRRSGAAATLLTVAPINPTGYGRVLRDKNGRIRRIVEERNATDEERQIKEVNTSVYCFRTSLLGTALRKITDANEQGELLLTDVVEILAEAGHLVDSVVAPDVSWAVGVNDRVQLAAAEAELRKRINDKWMMSGVTMIDPAHTYVDMDVQLANDVCLHPNTRLQGTTRIGSGAEIGPDCQLLDCVVGEGAVVTRTEGQHAVIGEGAKVGPYVVLEPGSEVAPGTKVGPFVQLGEDREA
jgi:bifunctional UDP-N-acetylglucosamine pyrophosphorylase / glucosamine-1-phosphate N-acetyltransferase